MWPFGELSRLRARVAELDRLSGELAIRLARQEAATQLVESTLAIERRAATTALRQATHQVRVAEKRATEAEASLAVARHDFDRMTKHLTNTLIRTKEIGGWPLADPPTPKPAQPARPAFEDAIDPGELEAFLAAAAEVGVGEAEATQMFRTEKGY